MNHFNILLVLFFVLSACKDMEKSKDQVKKGNIATEYSTYGENMDDIDFISVKEMTKSYDGLSVADTLSVKFKAKVVAVCKAKGCWMKLQLEDGQETLVKFKDYGFFVPKDIVGRTVVVNGLAFVEVMGVDDQKHFAGDGGKTKEEIAQITKPKRTYGFEADGVLLKK